MDCCSTGCASAAEIVEAERVQAAAERLACLLLEQVDFQAYMRLARAVGQDPQVAQILSEMNERAYLYDPNAAHAAEEARALEERLEAQPVVIAYRQREQAMRALFQAVDGAISAAAGAPFAELAKPSGHG